MLSSRLIFGISSNPSPHPFQDQEASVALWGCHLTLAVVEAAASLFCAKEA